MPVSIENTVIRFNDGTTQSTAAGAASGTVTSVATGNGLTGGTITTSGTLSITAPSYQSVGSYCGLTSVSGNPLVPNSNYSGNNAVIQGNNSCGSQGYGAAAGTWRMLGQTSANQFFYVGVRIS